MYDEHDKRYHDDWRAMFGQLNERKRSRRYLVAWRLCEACLDVEAASIMLFE